MTTELKHKESIFGNNSPLKPKTVIKVDPIETVMKAPSNDAEITITEDFENRVNALKDSKNIDHPLSVLQLEMQLQMIKHLEAIDWKLWEIYSKFVK